MPKSLVFWSSPPKKFWISRENVLEMDSAKYRNLFQYLKKKVYLESFTFQDKTTLRKSAKKFEYYSKLESLFYVAKEKDGTVLRYHRGRESEGFRRVPLCFFFWTRRPALLSILGFGCLESEDPSCRRLGH